MNNSFVAKLLIDLMTRYNRVSIPCLGSFMGQYREAYIALDQLVISPPNKEIDFHQNEIWNDEKLEQLVAETKNISLGKAKEEVAFWIDDVCNHLWAGEEVILPEFGKFRVNSEHKLVFEQDTATNLLPNSFGLPTLALPENQKATQVIRPSPQFVEAISNNKKTSTAVKAIGIIFVVLLLLGLVFVLFQVIMNSPTSHTPEKEIVPTTVQYTICLGQFANYNEARALVKQFHSTGYTASIVTIAEGANPYQVVLGKYESQTTATEVLKQLLERDSLHLFVSGIVTVAGQAIETNYEL